ncbi:hypothetical protein DL89DRAFT_268406 [Linderina pennispora]|uniref:Uncharacterized protein n=1 Tax=Linderina pennispora TaxID=61395 RepID=A0A1Y1W523_9FUNG|nr:uncharacterized protein DL89DRAFT_268406 [Linderina pennispora]ORX68610.1 hypothetical protein DL89DRAFT_268406 [Linderina pennispora]
MNHQIGCLTRVHIGLPSSNETAELTLGVHRGHPQTGQFQNAYLCGRFLQHNSVFSTPFVTTSILLRVTPSSEICLLLFQHPFLFCTQLLRAQ